LAAREHVFLDEIADAAAKARRTEDIERDPVVHHKAAGLQHPVDFAEIFSVPAWPDVLEHPDARDLVVELVFGQVLVTLELHAPASREAARGDLPSNMIELMLRKRDPRGIHTVLLRRPEDEGTPAAADVEQRLARHEPELAADVVELFLLRIGE